MDLAKIIEGCKRQDRRCQNALYKAYFPLMSSIALRYCSSRDDALHAMNYGFFKILTHIDQLDPKQNPGPWIRRVMVNHLIDEYRKKAPHMSSVHVQYEEHDPDMHVVNLAEVVWEENAMRAMLERLPEGSRTVFNLFALDGYSHPEIAERLGISVGTSKWHVNEARKRLKAMLQQEWNTKKKVIAQGYE